MRVLIIGAQITRKCLGGHTHFYYNHTHFSKHTPYILTVVLSLFSSVDLSRTQYIPAYIEALVREITSSSC